jgi:RNA polymerase sigma factor (sigma-70 family)
MEMPATRSSRDALGARLRRGRARQTPDHDHTPTALLVEAARNGDQGAWNALVERLAPTVWATARRHRLNSSDAADVFQTTWLRLLEHLDRIEQPERVAGWLATTARRECFRILRLAGRQVANGDDFDLRLDLAASAPLEQDLLAAERERVIEELLDKLPSRARRLLRLLTAESGLSYRDISESMSMPIGSIGPTRARALEQVRRLATQTGVSLEEAFLV